MADFVIDSTRKRTKERWEAAIAEPSLPTTLFDLLLVLIQRINDLEEALGYVPTDYSHILNKVNTQGR